MVEQGFYFRSMVDSGDIWQEAFRRMIEDVKSAEFPENVDKAKLTKAIYITGQIVNGSYKDKDNKKLQALDLNTQEYIYLTDLTNFMIRSKNYSETLNLDRKGFLEQMVNDSVKTLKDQGMSAEKIIGVLGKMWHEEVFTSHPTYNGSPEYTKNIINYFTSLKNYAADRGDENQEKLSHAFHKLILSHSVRKEDMSVSEESDFNLIHSGNAKRSVGRVYNAFDSALKNNFPEEFTDELRKKLKINIKFRAWGVAGGDKDGNHNVVEKDTAEGIKKSISQMIGEYKTSLSEMQDVANRYEIKSDIPKIKNLVKLLTSLDDALDKVDRVSVIQPKIDQTVKDLETFAISAFNNKDNAPAYRDKALELKRFVNTYEMRITEIEFRDTAENNIAILKNIIPADEIFNHVPKEYVNDANRIKNYEDLTNIRNINLQKFKDKINDFIEDAGSDAKNPSKITSFEDIQNLARLSEDGFKKEFFGLSLKDQQKYTKIEKMVTSEVRDKLISGIIADQDTYPKSLVKDWCDEAMQNLESRMHADPALAENVKATGYQNADHSHFYNAVKREQHVQGTNMCSTRVQAEATSALEYKENILFLRSVGNENAKIVLLFEDPEILAPNKVKKIIRGMLQDPEIFKHVTLSGIEDVKLRYGIEINQSIKEDLLAIKPVGKNEEGYEVFRNKMKDVDNKIKESTSGKIGLQEVMALEVQLAHSDNTRRAGMLAARSLIYDAHRVIKNVCAEFGVKARFFEGLSITDSLRGGLRAVASMFNSYNNHEFSKLTIQGIDVAVTYGNSSRGALHLGDIVANGLKSMAIKLKLVNPKEVEGAKEERDIGRILERDLRINSKISNEAKKYVSEYFLNDSLPYTIAQVYESSDDKHANRASRKARKTVEANPYYKHPEFDRTIIYSERSQQKGDNLGYVGAGNLKNIIADIIGEIRNVENPEIVKYKTLDDAKRQKVAEFFKGKSDSEITQKLFKVCPYLNEVRDREAFATASTDCELIWSDAIKKNVIRDKEGKELERIDSRPAHTELEKLAEAKDGKIPSVKGMLAWKELEYRKTAAIVYEAFKGEKVDLDNTTTQELRNKMKDVLDEKYRNITNMNDSVNLLMRQLKSSAEKESDTEKRSTLKDLMHNLKDISLFPSESIKSLLEAKMQRANGNGAHK